MLARQLDGTAERLMDKHQQRRSAKFLVTRENMHNTMTTGLRCMVGSHYMTLNGVLVVEVGRQRHMMIAADPTTLFSEQNSRPSLYPAPAW
jgi:hypothetical protein